MRSLLLSFLLILASNVFAQPQPGDLFKEYKWIASEELAGDDFLRVGGKLGYKTNEDYLKAGIVDSDGYLSLPASIDLKEAIKAEWVLEKIQSHEGTTGLTIQLNDGAPLTVTFPEIESQERVSDYMLHYHPIVQIDFQDIREKGNRFRLSVDSVQNWGWPQNIFYGIKLRVYYKSPYGQNEFDFSISQPSDTIVKITQPKVLFGREVDYVFHGEDVNWEGDGKYKQWHYHDHKGELTHHIGTSNRGVSWNTSWVPDQEMVKIGAFVHLDSDFIMFANVGKIKIEHTDYRIELLKPYDIPAFWSTRSGEFKEHFDIAGNVENITAARMFWTSWSPCYSNGVFINGHLITDGRGPCYDYYDHKVNIDHLEVLQAGKNVLSTALTPLFRGQMVHGMEVQYPGMMLKVKQKK